MLIPSAALMLLSLVLWHNTLKMRCLSLLVAVLIIISLISLGFYEMSEHLTGDGINEALIYHLANDLTGAGFSDYSGLIVLTAVYIGLSLVVGVIVYRISRIKKPTAYRRTRILSAAAALGLSLLVSPTIAELNTLYQDGLFATVNPDQPPPADYLSPRSLSLAGTDRKNIVHLYLESVERTYFDQDRFPGLMPNLSRLEQEALSFSDIMQVWGTGSTIAGMTASQCGIPLAGFISNGSNSMSGVDEFLPGAVCLGDLLSEQGYNLHYLGGASLDFAGKGSLYRTHQFDRVMGRDELKSQLDDPDHISAWGLYDESLYYFAEQRFRKLAETGDPFGLFLLTLDTHHPVGNMSAECNGLTYGDGTNAILNAVHCADKMAAAFIERLRESAYFKDTIIVVASDHLALRNTAWDTLESGPRRNLLMVLGEDIQPEKNSKPGSVLDVAPTVMSLAGYPTPALGFGRSLLTNDANLLAAHTPFDDFLASHKRWLATLWSFPVIRAGFRHDEQTQRLRIRNRFVRYPALFLLDEALMVKEVRFEFDNPTSLLQQLAGLAPGQRFFWVDQCKRVSWLANNSPNNKPETCALAGTLDNADNTLLPLWEDRIVTRHEFGTLFASNVSDQAAYQNRRRSLINIERFGTQHVHHLTENNSSGAAYVFRSAGGLESGPSYARNLKTGNKIPLQRGLTLLGLNPSASPAILTNLDTCAGDGLQSGPDLNHLMMDAENDYQSFAIVAHDSAICGEKGLERLFDETPFESWQDITLRRPYIGLINPGSETHEFTGQPEEALILDTSPSSP